MQQEELISRRLKRLRELNMSNAPLDSIGVRIRTCHIMSLNRIYCLEDLVSLTDEQLAAIPGLREDEIEDVKKKIERHLDGQHVFFNNFYDWDDFDPDDLDLDI